MEIKTDDKSTLEVITTDSHTGEGTEDLTIHIYNSLCKDSSYINLNDEQVKKLRDELNDWLDE